jgi:hypothetical protein
MRSPSRRAPPVAGLVGHDLEQPRPKRRVGLKTGQGQVGLEERVLGDIFSFCPLADDHISKMKCGLLVTLNKASKRSRVAAPSLLDDMRIFS